MEKRGQAAMEFLMTYGWAILAAIIVIGVLGVYFFRSDVMTPKSAVVNSPFYVNAWNARESNSANGGVQLDLENNGGETYDISEIGISNCGSNTTAISLEPGTSHVTNIDCGTSPIADGDTLRGDITITYTKTGSIVELTSTGSIVEGVVA